MRHRARLTAWLGLLALCAQLLAGGVSNWHMVARLAMAPSLLEICSSTPGTRSPADDSTPGHAGSASQHCPICLSASSLPLWTAWTQMAALPSAARDSAPALPAGTPPRAPDMRHAPPRAPPFLV